jgi:hypothetical protein
MNAGERESSIRRRAATKADQPAGSRQQACDSSRSVVVPVGGEEGLCYRNVKVFNMFQDKVAIVHVHRSIPTRLDSIVAFFSKKWKERKLS